MGTEEIGVACADSHHRGSSDIELIGGERVPHSISGPLNKRVGRRSTKLNTSSSATEEQDEASDYVEVTLDIHSDSVAVHSVTPAATRNNNDIQGEDEKLVLLRKGMEKKRSFGASVMRSASIRMQQMSQELKRFTSFPKQVVPPATMHYDRTKSTVSHALTVLKQQLISKTDGGAGWVEVKNQFDALTSSPNRYLHRSLFAKCIGMNTESEAFAVELFDALSRRREIQGDSINENQLKEFWDQISDQSFDSTLRTFFDMVDKNADGRINEEEIKEIIVLSASMNKLSKIREQAEEYAALIMEELDPAETGFIMVNELEMLLLHVPTHSTRGDSKYLSQMRSLNLKPTFEKNRIRRWYKHTKYLLEVNWQRTWVLVLWIGVMLGLFAYKFVEYQRKAAYEVLGHCVCMAKGAAETLKLNMAIILLTVCRNTITWLRSKTKLGIAVPFDDNIKFHKLISVAITIGVGIHAIYHLACDFPRLLHASSEKYKLMQPYFGDQASSYWHFVKSWEGVTGIIMVVLMAIAFTLASTWFKRNRIKPPKPLNKLTGFNAFWYSHHLFVVVYALLIVHGIKLYLTKEWYKKTTWMYLVIPIIIYVSERLTRVLRSSLMVFKILKVADYPGNVLALQMSKPKGFRYKSGQYIFIKCAAVSPFEWHPFYLTSSPHDDYVSVHIREIGDWTSTLKTMFLKCCQPSNSNSPSPRAFPKVLIDGPYGAPAQDYKQYEVVLLVGLGIGAAPMISIVKDIVNNMQAMEDEEGTNIEEGERGFPRKSLRKSPHKKNDSSNFRTERAYCYWVTREQGSFDWFRGVMNDVAKEDHRGVIELHSYCTSVYEEGDARSALIAMLQSLNHAKNGVDIVSNTRVKSHFAKPKWRTVFKRIAVNHPGADVGVFYCGLRSIANELRGLASDFSRNTTTKYHFHEEYF